MAQIHNISHRFLRQQQRLCALALIIAAISLLTGCTGRPAPIRVQPVPIIRLDTFLQTFDSLAPDAQVRAIDSLSPELSAMFRVMHRQDISPEVLSWWSQSDVVRIFQPDVDSVFSHLDSLSLQLGHIVAYARSDSLGLPPLTFATVTWGKPQPIVRVDSIVLIALNHYLGADYPGYSHWDAYLRANKTPQAIPYGVARALACTQHPWQPTDNPTLLNWMLYEGAAIEAVMRLVDNPSLALALGYTQAQTEYVEKYHRVMWREMASMQILYDTDPAVISRYIDPSPHTPLLAGNAPGRIGRYMGYKIVQAYIKRHPDATLSYLLSPEFYNSQQSLIESGY